MKKGDMIHLKLVNVTKVYGNVRAVDHVSVDICKNKFVTLLGPSGSGKTTTLMLIAGFETLSAGEIWFGNQVVSQVAPHKRNLGVVFQNYALFPHLTIYENVAFPLKMRHMAKTEMDRRVAEILELVKLPGYERRFVHQLSGGQQQRVALARALVFSPEVVLMDEPLGALDKQLRDHMQLELKQLQRDLGMTVLYVTHDQGEALVMSDQIAIMNQGRIEQIGTPEEVYERPLTRFVSGFIGESNFLEGKVIESRGRNISIVAVGTLRVAATGSVASSIDALVTIMVRPEKIVLGAFGGQPENVFGGTIQEVIYIGNHSKYRVQLDSNPGIDLMVTRLMPEGFPKHKAGQIVRGWWSANDAQIIPREAYGPVSELPLRSSGFKGASRGGRTR